jgi:hypothetical protein
MDVLSGLGCRIDELMALDWDSSISFDASTINIHGTVLRIPDVVLVVQPHTKSSAAVRTIRPPDWVMELPKRRHAALSR